MVSLPLVRAKHCLGEIPIRRLRRRPLPSSNDFQRHLVNDERTLARRLKANLDFAHRAVAAQFHNTSDAVGGVTHEDAFPITLAVAADCGGPVTVVIQRGLASPPPTSSPCSAADDDSDGSDSDSDDSGDSDGSDNSDSDNSDGSSDSDADAVPRRVEGGR